MAYKPPRRMNAVGVAEIFDQVFNVSLFAMIALSRGGSVAIRRRLNNPAGSIRGLCQRRVIGALGCPDSGGVFGHWQLHGLRHPRLLAALGGDLGGLESIFRLRDRNRRILLRVSRHLRPSRSKWIRLSQQSVNR